MLHLHISKESNLNINFLYVNDMQCNNYVLVTVLECPLFTLAGVAVDAVPHHCGCWLWPHSEQCLQTVETNRHPLDVRQINMHEVTSHYYD